MPHSKQKQKTKQTTHTQRKLPTHWNTWSQCDKLVPLKYQCIATHVMNLHMFGPKLDPNFPTCIHSLIFSKHFPKIFPICIGPNLGNFRYFPNFPDPYPPAVRSRVYGVWTRFRSSIVFPFLSLSFWIVQGGSGRESGSNDVHSRGTRLKKVGSLICL